MTGCAARAPAARRDASGPLPLFAREPHARPGQPGTRLRIGPPRQARTPPQAGVADDSPGAPAPAQDPLLQAEHRGRQIVWRLQARARAERGSELGPEELAVALEETTTLPGEVIARLARARSEEHVAAGAERARAADLDHAAATRSGTVRRENLNAARRETRIADTAGAHARMIAVRRSWQPRAFPAQPPTASGPLPREAWRSRHAHPSPRPPPGISPRPGLCA